MVKVSLDLEEGLHKAIRKKAIDKGITMKAYLIELIEKGKSIDDSEDIAKANKEEDVEEGDAVEEDRASEIIKL